MNVEKRLDKLAKELIATPETYTFNMKDLPRVNSYRTNIHQTFNTIFKRLDLKLTSCLYWFEVDNIETGNQLQLLLNQNRARLIELERTVPALNDNTNSKVLYVGIRRGGFRKRDNLSNLSGRIIIHLGYYEKGSTQGLQLVHWATKADCKVKLKVVSFPDLPDAYLNSVEKIVANMLRPMCGQH